MWTTKYIFNFLMVIAGLLLSTSTSGQVPQFLIPKSVLGQYAGSIGFLSVGAGYELFKNEKGSLDFHYGYVPENKGGDLHILTAKFAYRPIEIKLSKWVKLYPVNPGAFVSYHFGSQFDTQWDKDTYEKGYYWWSTALRPHISVSTELKLDAKKILPLLKVKALRLYYEFNTNELYLVSYYQNAGTLSITDIFKAGFGVRVDF